MTMFSSVFRVSNCSLVSCPEIPLAPLTKDTKGHRKLFCWSKVSGSKVKKGSPFFPVNGFFRECLTVRQMKFHVLEYGVYMSPRPCRYILNMMFFCVDSPQSGKKIHSLGGRLCRELCLRVLTRSAFAAMFKRGESAFTPSFDPVG